MPGMEKSGWQPDLGAGRMVTGIPPCPPAIREDTQRRQYLLRPAAPWLGPPAPGKHKERGEETRLS